MPDGDLNDRNQTMKYFAISFGAGLVADMTNGVDAVAPMMLMKNAAAAAVQTWVFDKWGGDAVLYALSRDKSQKPNYATDLAEGLAGALIGSALAGAAVRNLFFGQRFAPALAGGMLGSAGMFGYLYPVMRADL